jgi:sensor domain CHASE-containing protein
MLYDSCSKDQKRILWVAISLMIAVSVIVLTLTLWMLYQSNFQQRVEELQAMVRGQVSLIDAVARFDQQHSGSGSWDATLQQIVEKGACAHEQVVNLIRQVVDHTPPT